MHPLRSYSAQRGTERATEDAHVKILKLQAFLVLLVLSAIASSALVLEAGQRWR